MAKLPRRPDPARPLVTEPNIRTLPSGTRSYRIYARGGPWPTVWDAFRTFGPLRSRFDHHVPDTDGSPLAQERSILYAALDLPSAFAEVFQAERQIDRGRRVPWLAAFDLGAPVQLLDLSGTFPLRAGASMKLMSDSVLTAQRWSHAFHERYPDMMSVAIDVVLFEVRCRNDANRRAMGDSLTRARPAGHPGGVRNRSVRRNVRRRPR